MNYLLDTCVVSELVRPRPSEKVTEWVGSTDEGRLFLSVLTLGEVRKGIDRLGDDSRRDVLERWLRKDLQERFAGRILGIGTEVALHWGRMAGMLERAGKRPPVIDGLIAATAVVHGLVVVTRNTVDLTPFQVELFNPWQFSGSIPPL